MASYYCPECDEDYPKAKVFDDCPICDTNTLFRASRSPTVSMEEGQRRVHSKVSHAEFDKWCVAHKRTLSDPMPMMTVFLPRDYTYRDKLTADSVADMLEARFPQTKELHVVMRGL